MAKMNWAGLRKASARALAALGAAALVGCSTVAPARTGDGPALWKLADKDTTIYLFGTIHLLPENFAWRTPALDQAIAASDSLVLETVLGSDPMAAAQVMMKLGLAKDLPPLAERLPAERRPALQALIQSTGVPSAALDRMETWAAGLTLLATSFAQMGFDPAKGVEKGLEASYAASAKPVSGLETVEQQFGFFDQLSESSQRAFLEGVVDSPDKARAEFEAMLKAWSVGDTDGIAATFDSETAMAPELRAVLMQKRNARWADWLADRMDQPGTVMVAVGAGHLVGRDSVRTLLEAKGYTATRIQ